MTLVGKGAAGREGRERRMNHDFLRIVARQCRRKFVTLKILALTFCKRMFFHAFVKGTKHQAFFSVSYEEAAWRSGLGRWI